MKSEFYAAGVGPDGAEYEVARSRGFRWRRSEPPPVEHEVPARDAVAFRALSPQAARRGGVARLAQDRHRGDVAVARALLDVMGALRLSLHVFNTHDDVEKLVQGLQQALR